MQINLNLKYRVYDEIESDLQQSLRERTGTPLSAGQRVKYDKSSQRGRFETRTSNLLPMPVAAGPKAWV
jgi:hypothetical protein